MEHDVEGDIYREAKLQQDRRDATAQRAKRVSRVLTHRDGDGGSRGKPTYESRYEARNRWGYP